MPVLDIETAKEHLRVDGSLEDSDIAIKLQAATTCIEQFTGPLLATDVELRLEQFEAHRSFYLPAHKVNSVGSVRYTPLTGADVTLLADRDYYVDLYGTDKLHPGSPRVLCGTSGWPVAVLKPGASVQIIYNAGYVDVDAIPANIKSAILLELGSLYRNRESIVMEGQVPRVLDRGVQHLIQDYCIRARGWL